MVGWEWIEDMEVGTQGKDHIRVGWDSIEDMEVGKQGMGDIRIR